MLMKKLMKCHRRRNHLKCKELVEAEVDLTPPKSPQQQEANDQQMINVEAQRAQHSPSPPVENVIMVVAPEAVPTTKGGEIQFIPNAAMELLLKLLMLLNKFDKFDTFEQVLCPQSMRLAREVHLLKDVMAIFSAWDETVGRQAKLNLGQKGTQKQVLIDQGGLSNGSGKSPGNCPNRFGMVMSP
ncbi:hypothetical protein L7F22_040086 [Adiantum nelumboides]|nr:hypothetical protein [Adiantum nelumboides]